MSASANLTWFVAQTQPHSELKAAENLRRQGFEIYLPRYLKTVRHARRVSMAKAPLFPSYLFVKFDIGKAQWRAINSTFGVTRLVGNDATPIPLMPGVVESLKEREGADGLFQVIAPALVFKTGDAVRIVGGALNSCYGIFDVRTDKDRVAILLDLFGRKSRVVLKVDAIEAA
jgi:transcriptional antiterminator RfaH